MAREGYSSVPVQSIPVQRFDTPFINVLPEAISCCLQTCYVDVMLLLMDCVCILTFVVVTLLVVTYTNSPLL